MQSRWLVGFIVLLAFHAPSQMEAAVEPSGSLEQAVPASPSPLIGIDWYGWTYSNAFAEWNGLKPSPDSAPGSPVQIINQISIHTPAFDSMDFVFMPQFAIQPMQGERFQLWNPTVGIVGTVAESGGFSYWARYDVAVPLLAKSRAEGMIATPGAVNSLAYRFPNSPFKVEATIVPQVTFFDNGEKSAFLYASPRLYYIFNDSWSLITLAETQSEIKRGASKITQAAPPNLGVGFRYSSLAGKGLWVQPFINVYPFGRVASAAHLGVFFGGPLL